MKCDLCIPIECKVDGMWHKSSNASPARVWETRVWYFRLPFILSGKWGWNYGSQSCHNENTFKSGEFIEHLVCVPCHAGPRGNRRARKSLCWPSQIAASVLSTQTGLSKSMQTPWRIHLTKEFVKILLIISTGDRFHCIAYNIVLQIFGFYSYK